MHIIYSARILIDNTTNKCVNKCIGPILIYCLMRDRRQKEDWSSCRTCIFRQSDYAVKQSNMFLVCFDPISATSRCVSGREKTCFYSFSRITRTDH